MKFGSILIFSFVILFSSCKKENDTLTVGDTQGTLISTTIDTFSIVSQSVNLDTVPANSNSSVFLGSYYATETGTLNAQLYTTLTPTDLEFRIPDEGLDVASVSIQIESQGKYGTNSNLQFEVVQMTETVAEGTSYNTQNTFTTSDEVIGTFSMNSSDTGSFDFTLNNSIGEFIINQGNVAFTTSSVFADLFKGISIRPVTSLTVDSGAVLTINSSNITLTLNAVGKTSGTSYSTTFKPADATRTSYSAVSTLDGSLAANSFEKPIDGSISFQLQGLSALSGEITFSNISAWAASNNILINKATLTLPVTASVNSDFTTPTSITIHEKGTTSGTGKSGTYNAVNSTYVIEIADLISNNLTTGTELSYYVSILNSDKNPGIVSVNGFNHPTTPATISIFYTNY